MNEITLSLPQLIVVVSVSVMFGVGLSVAMLCLVARHSEDPSEFDDNY